MFFTFGYVRKGEALTLSSSLLTALIWWFVLLFVSYDVVGVNGLRDEDMQRVDYDELLRQRLAAKPWYARTIQLNDTTELPISPATIIATIVSIIFIISNFFGSSNKKTYAIASHILLSDHSDATKSKLENIKKKIQNNESLFAKYAMEISECPSGKQNGGNLGRFYPGDMAPPFDRAIFDTTQPQQSPLRTTIGPIHTNFGWHLIYIHERNVPPK